MSIETMIGLHPEVGDDFNEALAKASRHAMLCSLFCTSCADACLAEKMDMRQCIRTCLDCSDICAATAHLAVRRTGQNVELLRAQLELCIKACEICADECGTHEDEHCQLCATMCRECADDCRAALKTVA
ncbi:four-helix bundle copper-binding protein [Fulvimarina sp. 2208YS6-2-32]|uniref:Four-helix bundle copper-binding protein n=1 Tax=Fulvimarina uroteuthidis TaxID=3098149 RepID=A0ABU5I4J6_9HYPH|nr:four-helix bundle copper-binding protein [Fulvimarina sp. 2208YS6-2-32]MDY8110310.1 four-helix bundle copper-binding protein [Fulvimarina sp. 2208YS6-2-32]